MKNSGIYCTRLDRVFTMSVLIPIKASAYHDTQGTGP